MSAEKLEYFSLKAFLPRNPKVLKKGREFKEAALVLRFFLYVTPGYGDFTPVTALGKVLCVVYAIFGIPISILLLRLIGQFMLRCQRCLITASETRCLGRSGPPSRLNEKCFALGFVYLLLLLFIGAAAQMAAEGWSYGDSLYFYVVSFTTVGFGDLIPNNKYICVPFTLLGLTAISNILHAAASMALVKRVIVGSGDNEGEAAAKV